jgi:hypothetical protein
MATRTEQRQMFDLTTRVALVEKDADDCEREFGELKALARKLGWAMFGVLISTTTSALLLALNVKIASGR